MKTADVRPSKRTYRGSPAGSGETTSGETATSAATRNSDSLNGVLRFLQPERISVSNMPRRKFASTSNEIISFTIIKEKVSFTSDLDER